MAELKRRENEPTIADTTYHLQTRRPDDAYSIRDVAHLITFLAARSSTRYPRRPTRQGPPPAGSLRSARPRRERVYSPAPPARSSPPWLGGVGPSAAAPANRSLLAAPSQPGQRSRAAMTPRARSAHASPCAYIVYMHVCPHMHTCVCAHICIHACVPTRLHAYARTDTGTQAHRHTGTQAHTYVHVHAHVCLYSPKLSSGVPSSLQKRASLDRHTCCSVMPRRGACGGSSAPSSPPGCAPSTAGLAVES